VERAVHEDEGDDPVRLGNRELCGNHTAPRVADDDGGGRTTRVHQLAEGDGRGFQPEPSRRCRRPAVAGRVDHEHAVIAGQLFGLRAERGAVAEQARPHHDRRTAARLVYVERTE
jgi:hypothetical protein